MNTNQALNIFTEYLSQIPHNILHERYEFSVHNHRIRVYDILTRETLFNIQLVPRRNNIYYAHFRIRPMLTIEIHLDEDTNNITMLNTFVPKKNCENCVHETPRHNINCTSCTYSKNFVRK